MTIITGFLGAGKTSLVNHILTAPHGLRIAVLVNDFGAINIDAGLIEKRDGEVISLENGCICCSLADGLLAAAVRMLRLPVPPDRIVIETSGVSDPIEVARTFADPELQPYAPLDGIVTLVDAEYGPGLEGPQAALAKQQLSASDIVLLNKVDLVDEPGLKAARDWIHANAPYARVLETVRAAAPGPLLMDTSGSDPAFVSRILDLSGGPSDGHPEGAPPFDTAVIERDEPIGYSKLKAAMESLPRSVFRAKGIVYVAEKPDHRLVLQATGRRSELTVGDRWDKAERRTQLVFIGSRGGIDKDRLEALFGGRVHREPIQSQPHQHA